MAHASYTLGARESVPDPANLLAILAFLLAIYYTCRLLRVYRPRRPPTSPLSLSGPFVPPFGLASPDDAGGKDVGGLSRDHMDTARAGELSSLAEACARAHAHAHSDVHGLALRKHTSHTSMDGTGDDDDDDDMDSKVDTPSFTARDWGGEEVTEAHKRRQRFFSWRKNAVRHSFLVVPSWAGICFSLLSKNAIDAFSTRHYREALLHASPLLFQVFPALYLFGKVRPAAFRNGVAFTRYRFFSSCVMVFILPHLFPVPGMPNIMAGEVLVTTAATGDGATAGAWGGGSSRNAGMGMDAAAVASTETVDATLKTADLATELEFTGLVMRRLMLRNMRPVVATLIHTLWCMLFVEDTVEHVIMSLWLAATGLDIGELWAHSVLVWITVGSIALALLKRFHLERDLFGRAHFMPTLPLKDSMLQLMIYLIFGALTINVGILCIANIEATGLRLS
jgi:hypothetical protein